MWVDSGSRCVRGGLLGVAEAAPTAKCSQQHQFLCRLLRHSADSVLGLWWPFVLGQHHGNRCNHSDSQIWTSWTLCSQFDGLGRKQQGEEIHLCGVMEDERKAFLFFLAWNYGFVVFRCLHMERWQWCFLPNWSCTVPLLPWLIRASS